MQCNAVTEVALDWCDLKSCFLINNFCHHCTLFTVKTSHTICFWLQIFGAVCSRRAARHHPDTTWASFHLLNYWSHASLWLEQLCQSDKSSDVTGWESIYETPRPLIYIELQPALVHFALLHVHEAPGAQFVPPETFHFHFFLKEFVFNTFNSQVLYTFGKLQETAFKVSRFRCACIPSPVLVHKHHLDPGGCSLYIDRCN